MIHLKQPQSYLSLYGGMFFLDHKFSSNTEGWIRWDRWMVTDFTRGLELQKSDKPLQETFQHTCWTITFRYRNIR